MRATTLRITRIAFSIKGQAATGATRAATAAEHALRQLGEECEARGRRRVFDVLSDCLAAERQDVSYQKISKMLGIPEASVKCLVHELRVRYRDLLRAEVAQTVEKLEDVDEELRYLCAALAAA